MTIYPSFWKYLVLSKKRKQRLSELELRRRQLLDKLLEVEKAPAQKKKGMLREIYFEMFGGLPQDMIPEDRIPTQESEETEISAKKDDKKNQESKKKGGGFFGAVRNMFKSSTKAEAKPEKKVEQPHKQSSLTKSMIVSSPVYVDDKRDDSYRELESPTDYDSRSHKKTDNNGSISARFLDGSPTSSPGLGGNIDPISASFVNTTNGKYKEK